MTTWAYGWQYPAGFLDFVHKKALDVEHEPFGAIGHLYSYHSAHVLMHYQPMLFQEDPYWRDLLDVMGLELDAVHATLDRILEAWFVAHSAEWALQRWEATTGVGIAPSGVSVEDRRAAVLTKLGTGPRTVEDFEALIGDFFGLNGVVVEDYANYAVEFNVYGNPTAEEQEAFETLLRELIPAHLSMTVLYGGFIVGVNMAGDTI